MPPGDAAIPSPTFSEGDAASASLRRFAVRLRRIGPGRVVALQICLIGLPIVVWELAVRQGWASVFFFGEPSQVIYYIATSLADGSLLANAGVTVAEQIVGLAFGTAIGSLIALALWWSRYLSLVLDTYAVVLNATPKIVIAPLLVVWFGFGMASKIMIAVLITAVVAWLGAFDGVRRCDPDQLDLVRALGGGNRQAFVKIVVPSTLPYIFATLRLNIGFAMLGVITGEFLSSTAGLGYLIDSTSKTYEMSDTLGAILVIAAITAIELWLLTRLEHRLIGWSDGVQAETAG